MPYIHESERKIALLSPRTVGDLNYAITILVQQYMDSASGGLSYAKINNVMGVLECAKAEFYRRVAIPYEDKKIAENGDVYLRDYAPMPNEAMLEKALLSIADAPREPAEKRHTCTPITNWEFEGKTSRIPNVWTIRGKVGNEWFRSPRVLEFDMNTGIALCEDNLRYLLVGFRNCDPATDVPSYFHQKHHTHVHVHVSAPADRMRQTVRMMPEHLREKFQRPPRSNEPQRDMATLANELGWGKPLKEALKASETACRGTPEILPDGRHTSHDFTKVG